MTESAFQLSNRNGLRSTHEHERPPMSRAFVKEADGDTPDELPELPLSTHPNIVTAHGLAQLRQRLSATLQRAGAAAQGSTERALAERDGRWLQSRVGGAIVADLATAPKDRVAFGASVTLFAEGQEQRYRIVGEDEADPSHGSVSWWSPLAQALKGARVGDVVNWPRPAGDIEVEILSVRYDADSESDLDSAETAHE
jgi:transcription elongation factor GreB